MPRGEIMLTAEAANDMQAGGGVPVRSAPRQSRPRRRMLALLRKALPDFDFDREVQVARSPHVRSMGTSWSTYAVKRSDGRTYEVTSNDTMEAVEFWGLYVMQIHDRTIYVMADRRDPEAEAEGDDEGEEDEEEIFCAGFNCKQAEVVNSETDEEGVFWTLCRCGFWTEHPDRRDPEEEGDD